MRHRGRRRAPRDRSRAAGRAAPRPRRATSRHRPDGGRGGDWRLARRDSSEQSPDPGTTPDAVIQVFAARAVGWRGVLGVHTWIAVKPSGATAYRRYEVIGWGVDRGFPAVRVDRAGP